MLEFTYRLSFSTVHHACSPLYIRYGNTKATFWRSLDDVFQYLSSNILCVEIIRCMIEFLLAVRASCRSQRVSIYTSLLLHPCGLLSLQSCVWQGPIDVPRPDWMSELKMRTNERSWNTLIPHWAADRYTIHIRTLYETYVILLQPYEWLDR